jgi:serine protease
MKIKLLLALCLLLPLGVFSQSISPVFQDGKIWFKLTNETRINTTLDENPDKIPFGSIPGFERFTATYGVTNLSKPFHAAKTSIELQRTYLVEFSQYALVENFVKELAALNMVEYAEKVPLDHRCLVPNDPSYGSQWGLATIGAPTAWNYFSTGSTIIIAIVDDAVERTHPDLSPNLWVNDDPVGGGDNDGNGYVDDLNGWDVGDNDNNPNPTNSSYDHGTHVAGISSARANNGAGVASIGFSCKLMCVKSTSTPTAITNGYDGIVYAAANGADVINMSWGGPTFTTTGQNVCNYAWGQGCILVAAAGNDDVSSQFYPAAMNNVISVAATASGDGKASFSNYGSWVDISAPGNNIYSTTVSGTYGNKSGTSMASPLVAGLVGLMWSLNPGMTKTDLINCLYSTATNINAMNPGYIGQLGAGRINAANAMQCVSTTLNNPPVADFTANYTTITAGGQVNFTDLSAYTPTTWNWSFPGGSPVSFSGQNPPSITYPTAGTYNVTLTVSNANGTDTQTNTSYINVNPAGGCNTINLPIPVGWTFGNYYSGATPGVDGWVNGNNLADDQEKAMYFDASALPYSQMVECYIAFGLAYSAIPGKIVPVKVYDGTAGIGSAPGSQIGTTYNLTMGQIMFDANNGYYTDVHWPTPITLPASKKFFISIDVSNLQWQAGTHDTLSILSNTNGQTVPSAVWEKQSSSTWVHYNTPGSYALDLSLIVHPFLTSQPVNATFTETATTICQGEGITFDATGSTYQDTLLWVFPGGSPGLVAENPNPTVIFNTAGTHTVTMYVVGGGCSELDSAVVNVTVNPTPVVSVTAVTNPICNGGNTNLMASGASSYIWSPSTGLSATVGTTVNASPTTTTTYNIAGTTGTCTGNTSIQVEVLDPPTATLMAADDSIDCNTSVVFDGSGSNDATNFAWTYASGLPATSNASGDAVTYNSAGNHNVQMIVSNACGSDTSTYTIHVFNNCSTAGIEDMENDIKGYYSMQGFIIESANGFTNDMTVKLYNELGQLIFTKNAVEQTNQLIIPTYELRAGMYIVHLENNNQLKSFKFILK